MIYWTWTTLLDSDWFYDILELDFKRTVTTLLDLDWFFDILDLDLESAWTNFLDSDWLSYNQTGMLLQKSENAHALSVKQLVIQTNLGNSIFVRLWLVCEKTNFNLFYSKVTYFFVSSESYLSLI